MQGEEGQLFDLGEFAAGEKARKAPESEAAKMLERMERMKARELKNLENKLNRGKNLTAAEIKRFDQLQAELQGIEGLNLPEGVVRTAKEVAEHFGRTVRTIRHWAGRGMPQLPNGYDLKAIEAWAVREGLVNGPAGGEGPRDPDGAGGNGDGSVFRDKNFYETELKRVQSELKELELAKQQGKLIPVEDVEAGRVARITAVKRALLAIPRALAPQLVGLEAREIEALLMERMRDICGRFAQGEAS